MSIQGTFNAFTRGLDCHENLFYIGQSKIEIFQTMGISTITQLIVELLYLTTKNIKVFSVSLVFLKFIP